MSPGKRVVIVDDEVLIAMHLETICAQLGHEVLGLAHDAQAASDLILKSRPDYVLMDVRLNDSRDGVDVSEEVVELLPNLKVIFVTGSTEPATIARIETDHPYRVLFKPIVANDLREALS